MRLNSSRDGKGRAPAARVRLLFVWSALAILNACGEQPGLTAPPALGATQQMPAAGWQTYRDSTIGFSIDHPEDYVVLPPDRQSPAQPPQAIQSVRFQQRGAQPGEIPLFTIDVFERSGLSLRRWLEAAGRLPRDARLSPFNVDGAMEAAHVRLLREIAPNEFYYVAAESYVFSLTPRGPAGPRMVASFRLDRRQ